MGYQLSESGVELVDNRKVDAHVSAFDDKTRDLTHDAGTIRREINMEVTHSKYQDASDRV